MNGKQLFEVIMLRGFALVLGGFSVLPVMAAGATKPDFGPNVAVFDPGMSSAVIQQKIDAVYGVQRHNEFGPERNALLFLPGTYHVDVPVGFYTQVLGLGASPDEVSIAGNLHVDASLKSNNATTTFWRGAEGVAVTPAGGTMQWAVSQAVPFRRMHVRGSIVLHQNDGWASGGWMSDDLVDGNVGAGPQQQWISRNSEWGSWTGSNWNMVFVGVPTMPVGEWPAPPYTKVARTPVIREKPFLQVDGVGNYSVRVPSLRRDAVGITWRGGVTPGRSIAIENFYIAHAGVDTAAGMNKQLARGKNLLFMPGVYELSEPIRVSRPDTVVLGLGFATLRPVTGKAALVTADVDGIVLAGLLLDAGLDKSPVLLQVGPIGSTASHRDNPVSLHDIFFRVGGAGPGSAGVNLEVNSNDVVIDHTWIWRADHGAGVGWATNPSANGLVVNGQNVTAYGLFVEHQQEFQVLWNGEGGRTYFYQSEIPYDPPTQASFTSAAGTDGWAAYKVADAVKSHEAWGLGIYSVFTHPDIKLSRAIEVPTRPGIHFHHMITVCLGKNGGIRNVINKAGGATEIDPRVTPKVAEFPVE
ncbi:coagulation factor 5/8 type domain-containing protein [Granulicella arctica]|uniref:coagulation factor 5/8 type domain-containing protein n=1 Tax=Granulicella arctica TaxID=940613 RepID=UPI0021E01EBF|nr:coagulation factor 5/8 type domain-containing protein [Granulicella arctica]